MDVKRYKYWFYYLIDKEDTDSYELYAYTDNKEYARMFELTRLKKRFKKRIMKISRRAVNYLASDHTGGYLRKTIFMTENPKDTKLTHIEFIVTESEDITTKSYASSMINIKIWDHCWFDYRIFNDEMLELLKMLRYTYGYNMISDSGEYDTSDIDDGILCPDEFGMFMHLYGDTVNKNY